jgi:hypothetical protein
MEIVFFSTKLWINYVKNDSIADFLSHNPEAFIGRVDETSGQLVFRFNQKGRVVVGTCYKADKDKNIMLALIKFDLKGILKNSHHLIIGSGVLVYTKIEIVQPAVDEASFIRQASEQFGGIQWGSLYTLA